MTTSPMKKRGDKPVALFRLFPGREGLIAVWILLLVVSFNLINLCPEVAIDVIDLNDTGMHMLLTDLAVQAMGLGKDFTDPWQSTMGMGFPVFHYYQRLPHVPVALVHVVTMGVFPIVDLVNWSTYLMASFFPLSIYWSMRRFGFDRLSSSMGGLVASLPATNFLYGLGFTSYVWHGQGLYSQLWVYLRL